MPHRTICDVLDDMRKACDKMNFSYMPGLIEEAQMMANRMEASLWDQNDIMELRDRKNKLKQEVNDLEQKKKSLKK